MLEFETLQDFSGVARIQYEIYSEVIETFVNIIETNFEIQYNKLAFLS